jgi:glycosyltransferase involved in cell wall biosynthesis
MNSKKALFILHYSPPIHGASKVGDYIINSKLISTSLETKYIKIKGAQNLDQIGKFNFLKLKYSIELFLNLIFKLLIFRPNIIYFTVSPQGFAFYRDLFISIPIKTFCLFKNCKIFYHYHAKGINEFSSQSNFSRLLVNIFIKNANLIFISKQMKSEVLRLNGFKNIYFLNNGVENKLDNKNFENIIAAKSDIDEINILYLSNMIKEKGYDTVLNFSKKIKEQNIKTIKFHFAGGWSSNDDKVFFNNFVADNELESIVKYHGLVQGNKKTELFRNANFFIFPSRYRKEVFPLSVLEALSFGLPILAFNAGAISDIVNEDIGIITSKENLIKDFDRIKKNYLNKEVYIKCRSTFLEKYTTQKFEENLLKILKS